MVAVWTKAYRIRVEVMMRLMLFNAKTCRPSRSFALSQPHEFESDTQHHRPKHPRRYCSWFSEASLFWQFLPNSISKEVDFIPFQSLLCAMDQRMNQCSPSFVKPLDNS